MRQFLAAVACLLAAGCTSSGSVVIPPPALPSNLSGSPGGIAVPPPASTIPGVTPAPARQGLHRVHDPGQVTGTLAGPCHYRDDGQLPDPRCTPGAYDPAVTAGVLCSGSYSTRSYRPPAYQASRFKYESAYPAYGLLSGTRTELDHLVSLELGGSNDASNLWPEQPPTPNPKDTVENELHDAVCAGRVKLAAAQQAIARNWTTALRVLGLGVPSSPPAAAVPVRTSRVPASPAPAHAACHPLTSGGNCYEPGEFCRRADLGASGIAGDGRSITCVTDGTRPRWE